jgi:recombination protein RecA
MSLAQLRARIAQVLPQQPVAAPTLATGLTDLDAALGGGIPRGRLTELIGPLGAGTGTLIRSIVAAAVARADGVACIDASRTLDPAGWAELDCAHLRMIRPHDPARGAWCADVLLRSGAFALVVLDGAPVLSRQAALRLVGLARDKDATLLVVGEGSVSQLGGAMRLEVKRRWGSPRLSGRPGGLPPPSIIVHVMHGAPRTTIEIPHEVHRPRRLSAHPEVPDRRGVARRRRDGSPGHDSKRWKGARNGGQNPPAT